MAASVNKRYLLAILILYLRRRCRNRRRLADRQTERKYWVCDIYAKREQLGAFHTTVQEMLNGDRQKFLVVILGGHSSNFHFQVSNTSLMQSNIRMIENWNLQSAALQPSHRPIRMREIKYLQLDGEEKIQTKERKRGQDKRMRIFSFACPCP